MIYVIGFHGILWEGHLRSEELCFHCDYGDDVRGVAGLYRDGPVYTRWQAEMDTFDWILKK